MLDISGMTMIQMNPGFIKMPNIKKRGRPPTGQGEMVYIQQKLIPIIQALKDGDTQKAIELIKKL